MAHDVDKLLEEIEKLRKENRELKEENKKLKGLLHDRHVAEAIRKGAGFG